MKKMLLLTVALAVLLLTACGGSDEKNASGPFDFHEISVTIPDGYIEDFSRSDDNTQWFDSAWTKEQILIYRAKPPVTGTIGDADTNSRYDELIKGYDEVKDYSSSSSSVDETPALSCRYIQEEQYVLATYMNIGEELYGIMMFNKYEYSDETYKELIDSVNVK